jgi:hypothetical protein
VESHNANATTVTADCGSGSHATGGGGSSASKIVQQSYPSDSGGTAVGSGTNPRYWTVKFDGNTGSNTAYALCVPD